MTLASVPLRYLLSFSSNPNLQLVNRAFHQHYTNYLIYSSDKPIIRKNAYVGLHCDCCGKAPIELYVCDHPIISANTNGWTKVCEKCISDDMAGFVLDVAVTLKLHEINGCNCIYCQDQVDYSVKDYEKHIKECPNQLIRCQLCNQFVSRKDYRSSHYRSCPAAINTIAVFVPYLRNAIASRYNSWNIAEIVSQQYFRDNTYELDKNICFTHQLDPTNSISKCNFCNTIPDKVMCCKETGCVACSLCLAKNQSLDNGKDNKYVFNAILQEHNNQCSAFRCPECFEAFCWSDLQLHYTSCLKKTARCPGCSGYFTQKDWLSVHHMSNCKLIGVLQRFVPSNVYCDSDEINQDFCYFFQFVEKECALNRPLRKKRKLSVNSLFG